MKWHEKLFAPRDMTEGAPWKKLLIFVAPMLFGNIIQQLYNTVDAIVVGTYVGDNALAAVGSTVPLFFLLLVLFIGISSGAGIMVAQYFGAKKREELSHTIGACLTLLTIVSVFLMIFAPLVTHPLLELMDTPATIIDDAALYLNILLWGVLGVAYYNILTGILRGLGDSFSPLLYLIIACLLNIGLDLLFVAVFSWGVAGAAIATIIAQFVSGFLCLFKLMKLRSAYDFGWRYIKPKKKYIMEITKLGLPTGVSQAVFSMAMVLVQSLSNSFGELFIAANVIVMRIDGFVMMPNFTFGAAMMVFAGQNMGAGKIDRVKKGAAQGAVMAVGTSAVIVTAMLLLGRPLAGLFTDTNAIIDMSTRMLSILAAGYVAFAFGQIFWSVQVGSGDTVTPMWVSVISVIVIRVPLAYLMVYLTDAPESLFFAMLAAWVINSLVGFLFYRTGRWKKKGIVRQGE